MRMLIRFLVLAGVVSVAQSAAAQTTLTCESQNNRRAYCRVDTRGGVRLARQLSDAACRQGVSWDYDRNGIWVDRGCRAEFEIGRGEIGSGGSDPGPGWGSGQAQNITCASEQNQPNFCPADTRGGVRLVRRISDAPCREGDTWGYDRRGIWVDRGCRAEFEVRGGWSQGRPEIITCSSEERRRQFCPVDTGGGVRLVRQISDAACREGSSWGYDRRGIWVDRGCRAEFEVQSGGWGWSPRGEGGWGWGGSEAETQTITCESQDRRRRVCAVEITGDVRLTRQLSDTACRQGSTWGYDRRGIWVDRGCRAEFEIRNRDERWERSRRDRYGSGAFRACAEEVGRQFRVSAREVEMEDVTQGGVGTTLVEWRTRNGETGYCRVNRNGKVVQFKRD